MALENAKPFQHYDQLVSLLCNRGMMVEDPQRAKRKISQVGYYRLSGFWYPCREIEFDTNGKAILFQRKPKRLNKFMPGTSFNDIFLLYTFDKRLRLLLLDAIERIEINIRTTIAHELGQVDELAYQNPKFINPSMLKDYYQNGQIKNAWFDWCNRQRSELSRSKEDCIVWHKKSDKELPIWVAVEAWSFGTVSKYFELLKRSHQNVIASRLGVSNPALLVRWLQSLNLLRNRCAHHTRIWNQSQNNPLGIPVGNTQDSRYFSRFNLSDDSRKKLYGQIVLIWYLVENVGPNSDWIQHVIEEIDQLPDLPIDCLAALGIPSTGLSIDLFLPDGSA